MLNEEFEEKPADPAESRPPAVAVWRERALVMLIVASLGGTLNLVVSIHRRALTEPSTQPSPMPIATAAPAPAEPPKPLPPAPSIAAKPKPAKPRQPLPPPEDPTKKALGELAAATAAEIEAAQKADRKLAAHETARLAAVAESERWRRRELLVKQQVDSLAERARMIDQQIDTLAAQRDVLARERDALKAACVKAKQGEGSYAVLPYKGPNGSWRRPIVLECSDGSVTLRPKGPTFSMLDLSAMINPRSSPIIVAIARELLKIQGSESPDGSPVVPYFVFLVRPDGIRPYYELRARLEPLGIAFGYELVEQDLKIDVPDFDNLATWDGTIPLDAPALSGTGGASDGPGGGGGGDGLAWPGAGNGPIGRESGRPGGLAVGPGHGETGSGPGDDEADSPDAFVWPTQRAPGGSRAPSTGGSGSAERGPGTGVRGSKEGLPGGSKPQGRGLGEKGGRGGGLNFALERPEAGQGGVGRSASGGQRGTGTVPDAFELQPAPETGAGSGLTGEPGGGVLAGMPGDSRSSEGSPFSGAGARGTPVARAAGRVGQGTEVAALPELEAIQGGGGSEEPKSSPAGPIGNASVNGPATRPGGERAGAGTGANLVGSGRGQAVGERPPTVAHLGSNGTDVDSALLNGGARALVGLGSGAAGTAGSAGAVGLGMPSPSAAGASSASSGSSGMVLGSDASSASSTANSGKSDAAAGKPRIGSRIPDGPTPAIEVPFEITVVCQPSGLMIHPGGYQITKASLERNKKDGVLVRELLGVARQRAAADPAIRPQPRVKFLVENGGSTTFWNARKQILFSGLAWPMSLQISDAQGNRLLDPEDL